MKKFLLCFALGLLIYSCDTQGRKVDISKVERGAQFMRFDRAFFTSDTANLKNEIDQLASQYPEFFTGGKNIVFWKAQRTSEMQLELYAQAQKIFNDPEALDENLNFSMKHYYYYFPDAQSVKFYAYISNLDFDYPVLFADTVCFAALDMYLGPQQPYYHQLPQYIAFYRQPTFFVRDIMEELIKPKIPLPSGKVTLLDEMIYHGKMLYAIESMMPQKDEKVIIKYQPEKLKFCKENERNIWAYFIENNHLFSTSQDLKTRFIELAPFSKFRMKFDKETPGMIGRWVGWQIVRSYMARNPEATLNELLKDQDSRSILKLSGYKP